MIAEDLKRSLETTVRPEDTKLVRRLPVISEIFLNPESVRQKQMQEETVAALAQPKDNPWYAKLKDEYMGKILYDQKAFYRVFAILTYPTLARTSSHAGKLQLSQCTKTSTDILFYVSATWCSLSMAP